jgi:hypothetical protein
MVLTVHWWPTPVSVGGLLVTTEPVDTPASQGGGLRGLILSGPRWLPPSLGGLAGLVWPVYEFEK